MRKVGLFFVSISTLCFEINLTRLYSISQFYHYAFMVVSIALLGMGASGTYLTLCQKRYQLQEKKPYPLMAGSSGISMLVAYLIINFLPFDSFRMAIRPVQILVLLLHYALLSLPFFFSGIIINLMLRDSRSESGKVYAVNLVGSALGCLLALVMPSFIDNEGMIPFSAILAGLSGVCFMFQPPAQPLRKIGSIKNASILLVLLASGLSIIGIRIFTGKTPDLFTLKISPYKSLSYASQAPKAYTLSQQWNSFSRVDVINSPNLHSVPGLSYRYHGALPQIDGLFLDANNLNAILRPGGNTNFTRYLPASIAYQIRPLADVLILEPMGGMDVLAALSMGAEQVTAAEGNPLIVDAAKHIYTQEDVIWVRSSGRSFLQGTQQKFDIIHLPLTDSYHPVSSGAYALSENYRYTLESFLAMIDTLQPDGLLVVTRWLQDPPSEWLRVFTLSVTAVEELGSDPDDQIIAFRGYNTGTLMIKKNSFTSQELEIIQGFTQDKAYDLVFAPGLSEDEINRYNILPEPIYYKTFYAFTTSDSKDSFYQNYYYNIQPPTDDRPFFGHYFKWSQIDDILRDFGLTWQPFGGAGYLVVLIIFLLALVLSAILILLPVFIIKRSRSRIGRPQIPLYFILIGLGFMLVEIPFIQHFILYIDHPAYAFATILFCILLFSGLGSQFGSQKIPLRWSLASLACFLTVYLILLPKIIQNTLGMPLVFRMGFTILLVAPVGFLMGTAFPSGLNWMHRQHENSTKEKISWMTSWVWAVNGASSVVASILATIIALRWGFRVTLATGLACYILAGIIIILNMPTQIHNS